MQELIYWSRSTGAFDRELIGSILATARRRNAEDGVTGLLLYSDAAFLQVLEGEAATVEATFARICSDARHQDVTVLHAGAIERRRHPGWAMGFHHLVDPLVPPGEGLDLARARRLVTEHALDAAG